MTFPAALLSASDAVWDGAVGALCLGVAVIAGLADRRRQRRKRLDAVGWMPWTTVSFIMSFSALVLISLAVKEAAGR